MTRGSSRARYDHFYARTRYGKGKRLERLVPSAKSPEEAKERGKVIARYAERFMEIGRPDLVRGAADRLADAAPGAELADVCKKLDAVLKMGIVAPAHGITFEQWANRYTSGELARQYPDQVHARNHDDDVSRLRKYILPHVRDVPVTAFELAHAQAVMTALPPMSEANRRQVAQIMGRLMHLAVNPGRLVTVSPLPRGWLPKIRKKKFHPFLYPREEALLLGCSDVAESFRLFVGVANREGMRVSELLDSDRWQWNTDEGFFTRGKNKTGETGFWALQADTNDAMRIWLERHPEAQKPFAYVLALLATKACPEGDRKKLAALFRDSLRRAGVTREELFTATATTAALRAHDMRATFVTLSLAAGKPEQYIRDRTGHKSTYMIDRYRRPARQLAELKLGTLQNLVEALGWGMGGGCAGSDPSEAPSADVSQPHGRLVGSPSLEPKWRNGRRSGFKIHSSLPADAAELEKAGDEMPSGDAESVIPHASPTPLGVSRDLASEPAAAHDGVARPELAPVAAHDGAVERTQPIRGPARATPRERGDARAVRRAQRAVGELVGEWDYLEGQLEQLAGDDDGGE